MKSAKTYVRDIQDNLQILRLSNEEPLSNLTKDVSKLREATAVEEAERHRAADQRSLEERFTWVSTVDPSSNFQAAQSCLQTKSPCGSWFLLSREFESWMSGRQPTLWLYGLCKASLILSAFTNG
jgi:hypothetical protein